MTKHTAKYDGQIFTRTSQNRVYPFMVVGLYDIAADRAKAIAWFVKEYTMNLEHHQKIAAGHDEYSRTPEQRAERLVHSQAYVTQGVEVYVAAATARYDARVAGNIKHSDGKHFMYAAGWCSRLALAQKLASKVNGVVVETSHS